MAKSDSPGQKPGYYAILPAAVRYDDRLRPNGKLLYAEITALASRDGYCWADNAFFAQNFELTERSVQTLLKQLEELGYLTIEVVQKGNQNQPEQRRIWVQEARICSRINFRERGGADEQNFRAGEQNFQTTLDNNIINNNPPTPQGCGVVENGGFYKAGRFEGFWKFYKSVVPKGRPVGDKQRAVKAWCRQKPTDADIAAMGAALITASKQDDWRRGVGIPHAATWLNQRRWESAPETGTAGAEDERPQTEVARW